MYQTQHREQNTPHAFRLEQTREYCNGREGYSYVSTVIFCETFHQT